MSNQDQTEAGQLLAIAREAEGLASAVTRLQTRRYADGVALAMIWHALRGTEHEEGTGLPPSVNAVAVAREVCTVLKQAHDFAQFMADVEERER